MKRSHPTHFLGLGLGLALSLAGCKASAPVTPGDNVDAEIAALEDWLGTHPDDTDARRRVAQLYWLHKGSSTSAGPHLERLAAKGDPLAHFELAWMAYARLDGAGVQSHARAVIELATQGGNAAQLEASVLAEPAARLLDDVFGRVDGEEARFIAWYDGLNLGALPSGAADVLSTRRANLARANEADDAAFYSAQGCLQDWAASGVEGHLGILDLGVTPAGAAIDAAGSTDPAPVTLACAVRLWNTTPHPGIRRVRTKVDVAVSPLELTMSASEAVRVFVDGQPVYRNDSVERFVPSRPHLRVDVAPGEHTIEVQSTVDGERAWFSVRARDGAGRALTGNASPAAHEIGATATVRLADHDWLGFRCDEGSKDQACLSAQPTLALFTGSLYAPLRDMLALDDALADGDSDRAERAAGLLTAFGPAAPEARLLLADFENMDPSRARTSSGAREQAALESAAEADPDLWRAQLRLAQLMLSRQDASEALAHLEALGAKALNGYEGQLLRFAAYRAKNNELLADQALARAFELAPRDCDVLRTQQQVADERQQVERVDELTRNMAHCAGTLGLRGNLAFRRGKHAEAEKLYGRRLKRAVDDLSAHRALAEIAVAQRKWAEAQQHLEAVLQWAPWRATTRVALADVLAQRGDLPGARQQLERALERTPHLHRIWELASQLGVTDPIRDWRVQGLDFVKAFDPEGPLYEGAGQVLVLDRDVAWVFPDGSQRHLIHQITHLKSKAALDAHGELQVPDGAQLLTLRTIKPDGRVVEPESISGKEGLSLRELELGDMFEIEYVLGAPADPRLPGYVDLSSFRFASFDTPYHHSELVVVHPQDMQVQVESRNYPPKAKAGEWKGRGTLTFLASEMGRHNPEPGMRSSIDELPMVRVFTNLQVDDWLAGLSSQIRGAQRSNPELRAKVAELLRGAVNDADKLQRLWAWVLDNVQESSPIAYPATVTFTDRKGSALMLLRVMLREAGVRNELWLARDRFGPQDKAGGHPLISAYETPMLAAFLDGADEPVMVMTQAKTIPLGYLTPGYSGATAYGLRLADGEPASGLRELPPTPEALADARSYELNLDLDSAGTGVVEGVIELRGLEALFWRNELVRLDVSRRGEAFQAAELPRLFGHTALDLEALEITGVEDLSKPLRFEFRAAGLGVAVEQGGELLLPLAAMTLNLAANMATLPERETGMVIPFAPATSFSLTVKLDGLAVAQLPPAVDETSAHGRFEREVQRVGQGPGGGFKIEARAKLNPGVVEPEAYPELLDFAARVAAREQAVVTLRGK